MEEMRIRIALRDYVWMTALCCVAFGWIADRLSQQRDAERTTKEMDKHVHEEWLWFLRADALKKECEQLGYLVQWSEHGLIVGGPIKNGKTEVLIASPNEPGEDPFADVERVEATD
jgi:hypothetical protein